MSWPRPAWRDDWQSGRFIGVDPGADDGEYSVFQVTADGTTIMANRHPMQTGHGSGPDGEVKRYSRGTLVTKTGERIAVHNVSLTIFEGVIISIAMTRTGGSMQTGSFTLPDVQMALVREYQIYEPPGFSLPSSEHIGIEIDLRSDAQRLGQPVALEKLPTQADIFAKSVASKLQGEMSAFEEALVTSLGIPSHVMQPQSETMTPREYKERRNQEQQAKPRLLEQFKDVPKAGPPSVTGQRALDWSFDEEEPQEETPQ
jgi:hypothetical protein